MRIVTWNLWWRFGGWERRRAAIAEALVDLDADVVCLQEVWSSAAGTFADELAKNLGLHAVWSQSPAGDWWRRRADETPDVGIGNAILSRWPATSTAATNLPAGPERDEGRTALAALVATPAGLLSVVTTHLDSDMAGSATRCRQVAALAQFVVASTPVGVTPIVTGDLNAEPESDEVRRLCGVLTDPAAPGLVLMDAWRWAAPGDPGWTWRRDNPYAGRAGYPDARVDYVLIGPMSRTWPRIERASLAGLNPVRGVWPSDHAAVVVDLSGPPS